MPEVYAQYLEEFIANANKALGEFINFSQTSLSHEIKIYGNIAQVWSVYQMKFMTAEQIRNHRFWPSTIFSQCPYAKLAVVRNR